MLKVILLFLFLVPSMGYNYTFDIPELTEKQRIVCLINMYSNRYGLNNKVVFNLVQAESSFKINAVSKDGKDFGLMQIQKNTANIILKNIGMPLDIDIMEPNLNIKLGCLHLRWLLKVYKGNYYKALSAYNMGRTVLERRKYKVFKSTEKYVNKILRGII